MSQTAGSPTAVALPDLFADLFSYLMVLQRADEPDSAKALRQRIQDLVREADSKARRAGIPQDLVTHAKFAVVALCDEIVMNSRWELRNEWASQPMALQLFDDLNAGENFFRRLEELRRGRPAEHELGALEVFATCISLGFRGEHIDPAGDARLEDTLGGVARQVLDARDGHGGGLSPQWHSPEAMPDRVKKLPTWVFVAAMAVLVLALHLILDRLLAWDTAGLVTTLDKALEN
jgi:type VI secretion system protein ImpK